MTIIKIGQIFDPSRIDGQASLDTAIGQLDAALQNITPEKVDTAFLDLLDGPELVFELFLSLSTSHTRVKQKPYMCCLLRSCKLYPPAATLHRIIPNDSTFS